MAEDVNYDFVKLAQGDFPELAREIADKRTLARNKDYDVLQGAVTDSILGDQAEVGPTGIVQRAAAISSIMRERVIASLDRRKFIKGVASGVATTLGGQYALNWLGLSGIGSTPYALPSNIDYSSLWNHRSIDKEWLSKQFDGVSPEPDESASIRHLIYTVSQHGTSFIKTNQVISNYKNFSYATSDTDLITYLTYREAIDNRYLGFPDTSYDISYSIDLSLIFDKQLKCYVIDNFFHDCKQNRNVNKKISAEIRNTVYMHLDFDVADISQENLEFVSLEYGARGLLHVKNYLVSLISETTDQNLCWDMYIHYRVFAQFCMTYGSTAPRFDDGIFRLALWGLSTIAAKFMMSGSPRASNVFSDVYEFQLAPKEIRPVLVEAIASLRQSQSSPVMLRLALLKAIYEQNEQGSGIQALENILPNAINHVSDRKYNNKFSRELYFTCLRMGANIAPPTDDLFDPRFEGPSEIYELIRDMKTA